MKDIYFEANYGKLYEKIENGRAVCWKYDGKEGCISHQFILREIPIRLNNQLWYDIITPYGYGGPIIERVNEPYSKDDLITAFEKRFSEYCLENKIVSEFVRFHPLINNALDFKQLYNAECIRQTLGINLKDFENPTEMEFSKSCRKSIRQALNKGISSRITLSPCNVDIFKTIYYSTMDRNNAREYYYFDDEYFENCLKYFKDNILLVEALYQDKTVAAGVYFVYNKTIHIHLSGTLSEYLYLSPAYILRYAVTLWGKENGYYVVHNGGGRSNSIDDPLFKFKKQFSKNTEFNFYVGKKIWNQELYNKLCVIKGVEHNQTYFPAYRV